MSKRERIVLAGLVAAVLVGIALEPDHATMSEHTNGGAMVGHAMPAARTVTLAVSGMT
jgi:hypothetical protein